jgi:AraC family transcriptional regulator, carnitine catabolism transcriptional activator
MLPAAPMHARPLAPPPHPDGPLPIGFVLLPDFPLMAYAAAVEPLRAANVLAGRQLYSWWHASPDGAPVRASQGLVVTPDATLDRAGERAHRVFVCAGGNPSSFADPRLFAVLRRLAARHGPALGGISGGPFVLARAGLLDGVRCTLHWEHIPAFQETFPDAQVRRSLFEIDGARITCSGGIAALDMMLELVTRDWGQDLALEVSAWFLHNQIRTGPSPQAMPPALRYDFRDERLVRVLRAIDDNLERPPSRAALARLAGLSERQLERLFKGAVGTTLHGYGLAQRLAHAQRLARETTLTREEIAQASGFASTSELRRVERRAGSAGMSQNVPPMPLSAKQS